MSEKLLPMPYQQFEDTINTIKSSPKEATFLGQGAESTVWKFTLENEEFVAKFANTLSVRGRPRDTVGATESKIKAGVRGLGIRGLEQIRAASPQDGVAIYAYVDGYPLSAFTSQDMPTISPDNIEAFDETIRRASDTQIEIDGLNKNGGNVIYSPKAGLTIIDYWASERPISYELNRKFAYRALGPIALRLANTIER